MRETGSQVPGVLTDRGLGWQAAGFTLTGIACLVILKAFEGSDSWFYLWFETAAVDLYWAFILPLAVVFDGGRKLFEKGKAIREAKKAEIRERAISEGMKEGRKEGIKEGAEQGAKAENDRIRKLLEEHGVELPNAVVTAAFGDSPDENK